MATALCVCWAVTLLLWQGVQSAKFSDSSPKHLQHLYVCLNSTTDIPWNVLLSPNDVLGDVVWYFTNPVSNYSNPPEIVATSVHGTFLPASTFSGKVSPVGNAGISVGGVGLGDSGMYKVEVNVYTDAGASHVVMNSKVYLHVSDGLMTTDGSLHVRQNPDAIYDAKTDEWLLQLKCGQFLFEDNPPYDVEWVTPSGETLNSTSYENGFFTLLVPRNSLAGSFSCRIPADHAASACLHGDAGYQGHATLTVDTYEARMSILEAENAQMRLYIKAHSSANEASPTTTYIRWGHSACKGSDAEMVYTGYIAGSRHNTAGGGANHLCLTSHPHYDQLRSPEYSEIYGSEYQECSSGDHCRQRTPACAACRIPRSSALMIPGTQDCPLGWTAEYNGYIMSGKATETGGTTFICVDLAQGFMDGDNGQDNNQNLLHFTQAKCGALPCRQDSAHYHEAQPLTCVFCSK